MEKPILLSMRNVRIDARSDGRWSEIVKGVSLDLCKGEILGLVGESGAGKSSIGLAAMGYERAGCRISGGTVNFDSIDLRKASEVEKRKLRGKRIAYVSQSASASFNPGHKLLDQYCEGPVVHGVMRRSEAERDATLLYRRLGMPKPDLIGFRYPHQVSGGQLQRAMTAMAMSCRPDLIIFDEPTTALDVTTQIEVLAAIRDIVTQFDTAAIYITHDLAVVAQMANRIKVLRHGHEVEEAPTREILTHPADEYTKSLWAVRTYERPKRPTSAIHGPIVSMREVTASFGSVDALKNITFELERGRTLAVVGESGSGKTTLARAVAGLVQPRQGEILFENAPLPRDYRRRSKSQLRNIQLIYQSADTALNPKLKIRELIGRPAQMYLGLTGNALERKVQSLLELVELDPRKYIDRTASELSGGQRQRIGIARALASEPKLIICDEVTSALDQLVAYEVLNLLGRLQEEFGIAYMFITHDISVVRAIADDVLVMQNGCIVEKGSKDRIFSQEAALHPYTQRLLSSVPEMDPEWLNKRLAARA